ncbi:MAG: hypothetical protein V4803_05000 [Burkholderia gladioli]
MSELFKTWQSTIDRQEHCSELMNLYDLYQRELYADYEPLATASKPGVLRDFFRRLGFWIENFRTDDDQWDAFNSLNHLFFVGRLEMTELYRIAYETTVCSWLIDQANVSLLPGLFETELNAARDNTWICPITDSLRINAFRHINHLEQPEYFPDWRCLAKFGDATAIRQYIAESNIRYLVLIEDFVGGGTQVSPAVNFAATELGIPVLIVALIIADEGNSAIRQQIAPYAHMSYEPIVVLPPSSTVTRQPTQGEPHQQTTMRNLVQKYAAITGDRKPFGRNRDHGYFVVTYANCPNNSIRLIHADSNNWSPLFPRSGRRSM